jgi:hypothetical protein
MVVEEARDIVLLAKIVRGLAGYEDGRTCIA